MRDKFLPWLQNMHAVNTELGLPYHWAIENPDAGMKLRPYTKLENWPEPLVVARKTVAWMNVQWVMTLRSPL